MPYRWPENRFLARGWHFFLRVAYPPRMKVPSAAPFALLTVCLAAPACSKSSAPPQQTPVADAATTAALTPATSAHAAAAGANANADGGPATSATATCEVKVAAFEIDKGVRGDTGVTLATWSRTDAADAGGEHRIAVGYAKGNGTPHAAEVTDDGKVTLAVVPSTLTALDKKPEAGARRVVLRVLPLFAKDKDVHVAVDTVEVLADKTRHVRCGPADGAADAFHDGASLLAGSTDGTREMVECRSFSPDGGEAHAAITSTIAVDDGKLVATVEIGDTVLAKKSNPLKAGETASERYAFTVLGFGGGKSRSAVTARYNGNVVLALTTAALGAARDDAFWLGAPTNPPHAAFAGDTLLLWSTLAGKPELYGTSMLAGPTQKLEKAEKPAPLALGDDGVTERGFVSSSITETSRVLVVGEKRAGKSGARLFAQDARGAVKRTLALGDDEDTVVDAKLERTAGGDVFVAYVTRDKVGVHALKALVASCGE